MSARVIVVCEGSTEEMFINETIAPLFGYSGMDVRATKLLTSPGNKGGIPSWDSTRRQLDRLCKQDPKSWVTTLFDFYALPTSFPGVETGNDSAQNLGIAGKIETAMQKDLGHRNLKPHLQVHEFEAMLFSNPAVFAKYVDQTAVEHLRSTANSFLTPEHINQSRETAPSKRIAEVFQGYNKILHGNLLVLDIGLPHIRKTCPHFDSWLTWLESLA